MNAGTRRAVLVVEDDVDVVSSLRRILVMHHFEVESASTISAALERRDWQRFQAVILDRKLPDGLADENLHRFLERDPEMAIIIATGYSDLEGTIAALQHRVEDYLIKPVSPQLLVTRLQRIAENRAAKDRVRRLEQEIVNAVEEEKQRISMDLHDGIGSKLTAIQLDCRSLEDSLRKGGQREPADQANKIDRLLRETIGEVRVLSRELHPVYPDPFGLEGALGQLAERVSRGGKVACHFAGPPDLMFEDSIAANHLFRIAQEAVNNAVRHGESTKIDIEFREIPGGGFLLRIADNGSGFDAAEVTGGGGLGLHTMEYRARALGGTLTVHRGRNGGTEVICQTHGDAARGLGI
ncbi:MAG: Signal transduction histidine kinase [Verrucomicrobia bacterium]|jgi:signal transduction histidine kinase|nr:MAG: Signal transduction histidine kinase [Verrucomicrobiota bacterium]